MLTFFSNPIIQNCCIAVRHMSSAGFFCFSWSKASASWTRLDSWCPLMDDPWPLFPKRIFDSPIMWMTERMKRLVWYQHDVILTLKAKCSAGQLKKRMEIRRPEAAGVHQSWCRLTTGTEVSITWVARVTEYNDNKRLFVCRFCVEFTGESFWFLLLLWTRAQVTDSLSPRDEMREWMWMCRESRLAGVEMDGSRNEFTRQSLLLTPNPDYNVSPHHSLVGVDSVFRPANEQLWGGLVYVLCVVCECVTCVQVCASAGDPFQRRNRFYAHTFVCLLSPAATDQQNQHQQTCYLFVYECEWICASRLSSYGTLTTTFSLKILFSEPSGLFVYIDPS